MQDEEFHAYTLALDSAHLSKIYFMDFLKLLNEEKQIDGWLVDLVYQRWNDNSVALFFDKFFSGNVDCIVWDVCRCDRYIEIV